MIAIVNYGLGNIQAIANIYKRLNIPARIATSAERAGAARRRSSCPASAPSTGR